jgi:hypothetical protein
MTAHGISNVSLWAVIDRPNNSGHAREIDVAFWTR